MLDCHKLKLCFLELSGIFFCIYYIYIIYIKFYWSILDWQCCINFCCTAKWLRYTYIDSFSNSFIFFSIMGYHKILDIVLYIFDPRLVGSTDVEPVDLEGQLCRFMFLRMAALLWVEELSCFSCEIIISNTRFLYPVEGRARYCKQHF